MALVDFVGIFYLVCFYRSRAEKDRVNEFSFSVSDSLCAHSSELPPKMSEVGCSGFKLDSGQVDAGIVVC